ncbi:MAG: bifunctional nuclease family protein [Paludibacteraceae bacterium]
MSTFVSCCKKKYMQKEIKIHIAGMIFNQSMGGTYSLILSEDEGLKRRFSVLIGEAEAQSIALKLNNTKSPRPLSHDLMNIIIRELNARMVKVLIYEMVNDIFYAEIYLAQNDKPIVIDARTSDAVALAVRCNAPIFINSDILDIVGTVINDDEIADAKQSFSEKDIVIKELTIEKVRYLSLTKLTSLLTKAIDEENYEIAALIRDEIDLRKR